MKIAIPIFLSETNKPTWCSEGLSDLAKVTQQERVRVKAGTPLSLTLELHPCCLPLLTQSIHMYQVPTITHEDIFKEVIIVSGTK